MIDRIIPVPPHLFHQPNNSAKKKYTQNTTKVNARQFLSKCGEWNPSRVTPQILQTYEGNLLQSHPKLIANSTTPPALKLSLIRYSDLSVSNFFKILKHSEKTKISAAKNTTTISQPTNGFIFMLRDNIFINFDQPLPRNSVNSVTGDPTLRHGRVSIPCLPRHKQKSSPVTRRNSSSPFWDNQGNSR